MNQLATMVGSYVRSALSGFGRQVKAIELVAYECPVCHVRTAGTKREMDFHVNVPVVPELPKGLVFLMGSKFHPLDTSVVVESHGLNPNHSYSYIAARHIHLFNPVQYSGHWITSSQIREGLADGKVTLLTPAQIGELNDWYDHRLDETLRKREGFPGVVYSTPELEAIAKK